MLIPNDLKSYAKRLRQEADHAQAPETFGGPPPPETIQETLRLQNILQNADAVENVAASHGVEMEVIGFGPRKGTATGDAFRVIALPDGRLSIFVADGVGHDAQAVWENAIRFVLYTDDAPFLDHAYTNRTASEVISFIDEHCHFRSNHQANDAIALTHALFNPKTGEIEIANGGNPYPVIVRANGAIEIVEVGGAPLSNPEMGFEYRNNNDGTFRTVLAPGDVVILMTDGLPDGIHRSGAAMHERLPDLLRQLAQKQHSPDELFFAIAQELAHSPDDVTLLTFGVPAPGRTVSRK